MMLNTLSTKHVKEYQWTGSQPVANSTPLKSPSYFGQDITAGVEEKEPEINQKSASQTKSNSSDYVHLCGQYEKKEDLEIDEPNDASPYVHDEEYLLGWEQIAAESGTIAEGKKKNSNIQARDVGRGDASFLKTFLLLLKAFVGTGVLFLPRAFFNGGLLFSSGMLIMFAVLSYYCYYLLAKTTVLTNITSFVSMGNTLYGKFMMYLILISIVISQCGFVATYVIFTAENIRAFIFNTMNIDLPMWAIVSIEAVCIIPLSLIRNLTKLSLSAIIANIFILFSILVIVIYTSIDLVKDGPRKVTLLNQSSWSLFIGVAIFAFEGIGLIIPIQQSMRRPQDFPLALAGVIIVCVVLFIGVGALGYFTYGESINSVVIMNLPQDSYLVMSIQLIYALAIMLSIPLQLLPAIKMTEDKIFVNRQSGSLNKTIKWVKNVVRAVITILICLLAYLGSRNLDLFVSFVGCFACIPLVYMYPPMLHAKALGKKGSKGIKTIDWILVVFGGVATVYTTYDLINSMF